MMDAVELRNDIIIKYSDIFIRHWNCCDRFYCCVEVWAVILCADWPYINNNFTHKSLQRLHLHKMFCFWSCHSERCVSVTGNLNLTWNNHKDKWERTSRQNINVCICVFFFCIIFDTSGFYGSYSMISEEYYGAHIWGGKSYQYYSGDKCWY